MKGRNAAVYARCFVSYEIPFSEGLQSDLLLQYKQYKRTMLFFFEVPM